jgi:hypothetical protein
VTDHDDERCHAWANRVPLSRKAHQSEFSSCGDMFLCARIPRNASSFYPEQQCRRREMTDSTRARIARSEVVIEISQYSRYGTRENNIENNIENDSTCVGIV